MTVQLHRVSGCAPAPLANYLKALGVMRLVVEQGADPEARAWWDGEEFCLLSKLSREELERFFLEEYQPTPLLSPWNKGSGFFQADDPGLAPLEGSQAERFAPFRRAVAESRRLLGALTESDVAVRAIKDRTKTNKAFQSEEQRSALAASKAYRSCVETLQQQLAKPELPKSKRSEIEEEIAAIDSLIQPATKPPTKSQADRMKASSGYKKLLAAADRQFKVAKAALIPSCQREWRGPQADWLSVAVVLDEAGEPDWPSLLGTGGNDGRLDFTNNYMQQVGKLFDLDSEEGLFIPGAHALLANALWMKPSNQLVSAAIGQYQPGASGGANSSTGLHTANLVNPWDFILMLEGTLLFNSRATRRLDPNAMSRASAPFAIRAHAAGFASPGSEKAQRGEQWMPLWSRPATLGEVVSLFGEARLQLDRQTANRPVDAARAISRLGVARGIEAFIRYGYLERNGQSNLAVPLGRIRVKVHQLAHLIDDLAPWMSKLQRRTLDAHAPARLLQVERQLADAVLAALTHDRAANRWQAILQAAVEVEALQATGSAIEAQPIPRLSPEWIAAVDDNSVELRLALALGSAAGGFAKSGRPFDPIRHHWLPLEPGCRRFKVSDKRLAHDPRVVFGGRDPFTDCTAVVQRRMIEAQMQGQRRLPLQAAPGCGATLADLAAMLSGALDLNKISSLARAFMALDWSKWSPEHKPEQPFSNDTPDEPWLAIRLACLPWPLSTEQNIPAESNLVRRLMVGDAAGAVALALTRLRSAGIRPPLQAGVTSPALARLWAAALAFPIHRSSAIRAAAILAPSQRGHARV